MEHHKWWCKWLHCFNETCPRCWLFRFQYGYRLDPVGYMADRDKIFSNPHFSKYERVWLLNKVKPIEISYE